MYDKARYWNLRKNGKRGQGKGVKPAQIKVTEGSHMVNLGSALMKVNRKRARGRIHDRTRSASNYKKRIKMNKDPLYHVVVKKVYAPIREAYITNNTAMHERELFRIRSKNVQNRV